VPSGYDFVPLLEALKKYNWFEAHSKYKNNYDYQLAILLLNNKYYMSNNVLLLVENEALFSAISQLHYSYYTGDVQETADRLGHNADVQCIVGRGFKDFGTAQEPSLTDFADGVDTMAFLTALTVRQSPVNRQ
jgi:hypothetical protein